MNNSEMSEKQVVFFPELNTNQMLSELERKTGTEGSGETKHLFHI